MPAATFSGGVERQPQRSGGAALLADDVPQVIGMHPQLELRVVSGTNDLGAHVVGVIDDPARHVQHQITEEEIGLVGFARSGRGRGYGPWGSMDDSRSPASRKIVTHRANKISVGRAELSFWTARALAERAAPTSQISITVLF